MHLLSEGQIKCFCFRLETHIVSLTWLPASTLLRLLNPRLLSSREHLGGIKLIFPHRDVDMWGRVWTSRFRGAWQSLNFDKEYLFGFEILVFATSGILSMHNQLVTLQQWRILDKIIIIKYFSTFFIMISGHGIVSFWHFLIYAPKKLQYHQKNFKLKFWN